MDAVLAEFADRICAASAARRALCVRSGGTKDFYGNPPVGETLDPRAWQGIEDYEPSELVVTARAGTPLQALEATLAEHGQMLAFEPPHFGSGATVGGCIAAGLAGPRRCATGISHGSVRDFVLGARLLDGQGRLLRFGGTVMKNVAGYDVARVLAGSLGVLGLIVDVSIKVLPQPLAERSVVLELDEAQALQRMTHLAGQPLPLTASAWCDGRLTLRLAGATAAVAAAQARVGGEALAPAVAAAFWRDLREHRSPWFDLGSPLWRVALPATAAPLQLPGRQLIEWNGAQRWIQTQAPAVQVRALAAQLGGHATLFRGGDRSGGVFTPLSPAQLRLHQGLKAQFDPAGIFNPGRLVPGL